MTNLKGSSSKNKNPYTITTESWVWLLFI